MAKAQVGDLVVFGRGGTSTGQQSFGIIVGTKRGGKYVVRPYSPRGSPPKPIGCDWTMPGSIIQKIIPKGQFNSDNHGIPHRASSRISSSLLMYGAQVIVNMKVERKIEKTRWKSNLKIRKGDLFTMNGDGTRLYELLRINTKTCSVKIYDRQTDGRFHDGNCWVSKISPRASGDIQTIPITDPNSPIPANVTIESGMFDQLSFSAGVSSSRDLFLRGYHRDFHDSDGELYK